MYIIDIVYTKPLDVVKEILPAHREYLKKHYEQGVLIMSGPKKPLTGGMIVAKFESLEQVNTFIANDPYSLQNAADYSVTEFDPVLHQIENF